MSGRQSDISRDELRILGELERKVLWLASYMIHHANHVRESVDGLKVRAHGWGLSRREGRMVALVGDAELDEGNIFEAMLEGWKQGLRNCWWIVDYNRQSLDAVVREGLWQRFEELFRAFGWDVVILKYGSLLEGAFREPGGEKLRDWID